MSEKISKLVDLYQNDLSAIELTHQSFDEKEKVLMSSSVDQITEKETRSKVTDPTMLSAVLKQNNQVMAQMPSGKVTALTKENKGKSAFMDVILHNHILPNANSQYDPFTKFWMLSFYRKVYGSFGVLVDFMTNKSYTGPDFTLLPARSIIPQSGKVTVEDSDRLWVRSRVSKSWLEDRDPKYWKNIDKILETKGDSFDTNAQSYVERSNSGIMVKKDEFELVTCYEGDRWRTFHAATKTEIRDLDKSKGDNKIPVVMCHSYPLLDRFFGLGDFERGMTLHSSLGSLINLYMDGVKMGIFPPTKVDPSMVENWDDFKDGVGPGQIYLMRKSNFDGIEQMTVNPSGIQSFQSTYQFLKAAILTVTNTSDTSISQKMDPGFGKTPQALKMQAFSQGMQTQFDRRMLELSVEKIYDRMIDLVARRQEKPMEMFLKGADLEKIKSINPDVVEMFEVGDMGKVKIKPQDVNNVEYRYEIDQGSTTKKDEMLENSTLSEVLAFVAKIPGAMELLATGKRLPLGKNKSLDLGELVQRWMISGGTTDWDKIIVDDAAMDPQAEEGGEGEQVQQDQDLNMEDPNIANVTNQALRGAPEQTNQPINLQDPAISQAFSELQNLGANQ